MKLLTYCFVFIGLFALLNLEASPVELQPHRAYYTISLAGRPDPLSEVSDIRGTMMIEFNKVCGGYTVQQLSDVWRYLNDEDSSVEHVRWGYTTFESDEGTSFKFYTFRKVNDELVEDIQGTATKNGEIIQVNYQKPERKQVTLAEGTLFPQQHIRALLQAAAEGERVFPKTVFDGSSMDGASEINTFIGAKKVGADAKGNEGVHQFDGQAYWPVRFAVYGLDKSEYEPEYITTQELLPNGIIKKYNIDYGGVKINGVLDRVELLSNGGC